jgi:hypothetical protein
MAVLRAGALHKDNRTRAGFHLCRSETGGQGGGNRPTSLRHLAQIWSSNFVPAVTSWCLMLKAA